MTAAPSQRGEIQVQINRLVSIFIIADGEKTLRNDTSDRVTPVGTILCVGAEASSGTHGHWKRKSSLG